MSVLKSKRKESKFEVFAHATKLRKEITNFLICDFGFDFEKAETKLQKRFGGKGYDELNEEQQKHYIKLSKRWNAFDEWFIADERKAVIDDLRLLTRELYIANSIYPTTIAECEERRIHQDRAIGLCHTLAQELQYVIETLPVDIDKFLPFGEMIATEISLIKGWRKANNKIKGAIPVSSTNFANVNGNGNANSNNASNTIGVRPDFTDPKEAN